MSDYKFDIGEQVIYKYYTPYIHDIRVGTIVSRKRKIFGLCNEYVIKSCNDLYDIYESDIWKYEGDS